MKDYYYILGLESNSTLEEIKSAYRKLSKKFHPDVNQGDKFFEQRFKEINEAYEVLSDDLRKKDYDRQRNSKNYHSNTFHEKPRIVYFKTNKTVYSINEGVKFSWHVQNATSCNISIFGAVEVTGEKTIKFKKEIKSLRMVLFAKSLYGEEKKEVEIDIVSGSNVQDRDYTSFKAENSATTIEKELTPNIPKNIFIASILIFLAVGLGWNYSHRPEPAKDTGSTITYDNFPPEEKEEQHLNYIPENIKIGINKIRQYYSLFKNVTVVSSNIQSFYNPIIMDYHGRNYVTSLEAKNRDVDDFISNNIKSYIIEVNENDLSYQEYEYYYLYSTNLRYKIIKNNGKIIDRVFPINIALTKDKYKILGISKSLNPYKINKLITEEAEVNSEDRIYYERNVNDPNIVAIRNLIDDYNTNNLNVNVPLDTDVGSMMDKFDKKYFKSKFMLLAIEDAKYGGKWATILFIDKPDRGFFVWVYDGRIKGFGDAKLPDEFLLMVQSDLNSFDKRYGF